MRALVGRRPLLRVRACLSLVGLLCHKPAVRRGFVVLPRMFARCLALEGSSCSEVPARDGTDVCSFQTWRCVQGPVWF
ncbi:hypothetical protein Taro_028514 [Colocasia esculenta]|uniref:Uncharacterized protein n=1 Tax=Colocasia esculenta TaxID=4460 RepID=A0A843VIT6_COLES|nr:hypothetical protein [Colocasia esculenta]